MTMPTIGAFCVISLRHAARTRVARAAEWRYNIRHMAKREALTEPDRYKLSVREVPPKTGCHVAARKSAGPVTIGTVRKGLPIGVFKSVAANLEMSDRELARALNIPSRTSTGGCPKEFSSPEESDRLARVAKIFNEAREVFRSPEKARAWIEHAARRF